MNEETKLKKWTLTRWKQEAWKWCSEYNRRKDTNENGTGYCCTCQKQLHWTQGDAGHFQSGRASGILFYDNGIHLQCKFCNGPGGGEQYKYGLFIEKRYGKEEVTKQQNMKWELNKYSKQDYQMMIDEYKAKIEAL